MLGEFLYNLQQVIKQDMVAATSSGIGYECALIIYNYHKLTTRRGQVGSEAGW